MEPRPPLSQRRGGPPLRRNGPPPALSGRTARLQGALFTAVHVLSILFDTYVHFGLVSILVPLTGTWHPVAVAWGIVGFYALLAVELTSLARLRVPKALWRRVHFLSFLLFAATTVHALAAGTDARSGPFVIAVLAGCGVIGALTAVRVGASLRGREERTSLRTPLEAARRDPVGVS